VGCLRRFLLYSPTTAAFQSDADQARTQLSQELHVLEAQRQDYEGEIERIQSRSHNLTQKTLEVWFGTNTKLMMQSAFNRIKNCALEGRARKIVELQESVLHIGENTAFKLLQYETAITMATDYCIRRLLPSVAFLTWRVATERSINQKQNEQFEDEKQRQQEELHLMVTKSTKKPGTRDCGTETIEASNNFQNQPVQMLSQTSNSRTVERDGVRSFERDNVSPNSPLRPDGQHQTLSQLASFLMPAA